MLSLIAARTRRLSRDIPTPKNRFRPLLEELEDRTVLSPVPLTEHEQFLLELINRARLNPAAEAVRFGIDLNEGLASGSLSAGARQPLAANAALLGAIRGHLDDMLANQFFSHTGTGGSSLVGRTGGAGYGNYVTLGENLAWRGTTATPDLTDYVTQLHRDLFVDTGIAGRGHRVNLLNGGYKEVGPGVDTGAFLGFNSVLVGQDFGARSGNSFLTGVVYRDIITRDNFYSPGEGLGGVTITARSSGGDVFTETTGVAGGYQLRLPPGTYTVTVSGSGLPGPITASNVVVGSLNVKRDFTPASAPSPVSPSTEHASPAGGEEVLVTSGDGGNPVVRVFDARTRGERFQLTPYPGFGGSVRVAAGDFNGDGIADIITGAGEAGGHVKLFDGVSGNEVRSFYAFPGFSGGVFVAAGDVNGDGRADIVVGSGPGGAHVKVFDGITGSEVRSFIAFAGFTGGVTVAAGDVDGDGRADVIVGSMGGAPNGHVKVFSGASGAEIQSYFAYVNYTGGVYVAAGDINGDGHADIITGAGNSAAHVKVFDGRTRSEVRSFIAYPGAPAGVRVGAADRDGDGRADIVTVPGPGGGPHVRVFSGLTLGDLDSFFSAAPALTAGHFIAGG